MRYYQRAAAVLATEGIRISCAAAGSEGRASRRICESAGFLYVESPNRPLSSKWNRALRLLRPESPDAVVIIGSDDWLSYGLLRGYADFVHRGCDFVSLREIFILDAVTRRCLRFRGHTGVGRMVGRQLLDRLGWQLWPPRINRLLDTGMNRRLASRRPRRPWRGLLGQVAKNAVSLDIKTGTNLWGFKRLARSGVAFNPNLVLRHFSHADRVELELAMRKECPRRR